MATPHSKAPRWWKASKASLSGLKASDNVGSDDTKARSVFVAARPDAPRGRAAAADRQGQPDRRQPGRRAVERRGVLREAARADPLDAGLPAWLSAALAGDLAARRQRVEQADPTGRPLLALDADTREMLAQAATRGGAAPGSTRTSAARYRRVVAVDCAAQRMPWQDTTRDGYQLRRSAWQAVLLDRAAHLRREAEAERKAGHRAEWVRLMRAAWEHATSAAVLLERGQRAAHKPGVRSARRKPHPPDPFHVLGILETQRQGRVFERYALPFAAVGLFGVRPAELAGLVLEVAGDTLRATVRGAKVSAARGQPLRVLECSTHDSRAAAWAAQMVSERGSRVVLRGGPALVRGLNRTLARVLPGLSCYVYRHALASRLKADGTTAETLAATLGHASTRSAARYGRRRHCGGGIAPRCVRATRQPRQAGHLRRPVMVPRSTAVPRFQSFADPMAERRAKPVPRQPKPRGFGR